MPVESVKLPLAILANSMGVLARCRGRGKEEGRIQEVEAYCKVSTSLYPALIE